MEKIQGFENNEPTEVDYQKALKALSWIKAAIEGERDAIENDLSHNSRILLVGRNDEENRAIRANIKRVVDEYQGKYPGLTEDVLETFVELKNKYEEFLKENDEIKKRELINKTIDILEQNPELYELLENMANEPEVKNSNL